MKNTIIKILKIGIPIGIGIYLTWYFYSGLTQEGKDNIPVAFASANYFWIFISLCIAWLSHFSRAYRWKFMLEPLGYKPNLWSLYHSVMIGYIINFTVPRAGEFARAGFLSKKEKLPFDKVFGTIVAERVVDLVMLGFVTLITFYFVGKDEIYDLMVSPNDEEKTPWLLYSILIIGILGILAIVFSKKLREFFISKMTGVLDGVKAVFRLKKRGYFILHTLIIWISYILMFWIFAFSMESIQALDAKTLFACFFVGSIAIAATPGGIGLFPIFVTAALFNIGNPDILDIENLIIPEKDASSFAIMLWVAQTIFLVSFGLFSLFKINVKFNAKEISTNSKEEVSK